jgi:hypothetical protein
MGHISFAISHLSFVISEQARFTPTSTGQKVRNRPKRTRGYSCVIRAVICGSF